MKYLILFFMFSIQLYAEQVKWNRKVCRMNPEFNLTKTQQQSLCNASIYYDIDLLEKNGKQIVLLREHTHFRNDKSAQLGRDIVKQFNFRGIENLTWEKKGNFFNLFKWSNDLFSNGSTVKDAITQGYYFHIHNEVEDIYHNGIKVTNQLISEYGQLTGETSWVESNEKFINENDIVTIHLERDSIVNQTLDQECPDGLATCDDIYLVNLRDKKMQETIVKTFDWFSKRETLLVITGHGHGAGLLKELHCESGFTLHKVSRGASCLNSDYPGYFESLAPPVCENQ